MFTSAIAREDVLVLIETFFFQIHVNIEISLFGDEK